MFECLLSKVVSELLGEWHNLRDQRGVHIFNDWKNTLIIAILSEYSIYLSPDITNIDLTHTYCASQKNSNNLNIFGGQSPKPSSYPHIHRMCEAPFGFICNFHKTDCKHQYLTTLKLPIEYQSQNTEPNWANQLRPHQWFKQIDTNSN